MHRNRTWLVDSTETVLRTQRNRILPIEGGDGSTLTLDFTTGQLDPRLTFTRASNATFINSGGLVEWANANMAGLAGTNSDNSFSCYNTGASPNFETPTLVSGPTGESNTAASFTLTAAGFLDSRFGTSGGFGTITNVSIGLTYTVSFYFKALRGNSPIAITSRAMAGTSTPEVVTNVVDVSAPNGFTYRTCRFTATATTYAFAVVYGGGFQAGDVLVYSSFQMEPGTVARSYVKTTGTPYQAPRFDHDPTTRAPRGLLIEGTVTNSVFRSQALNTSPWSKAGAVSISETGSGSPANDSTSNVLTWTNSTAVGNAWLEQSLTVAGSQPYTWSVWLKPRNNQRVAVYGLTRNSGGTVIGNIETTVNFSVSPPTATNTVTSGYTNVTTPTLTEYPNGWYRMVMTGTTPATAASTTFGISNKDAVPSTGTNGCEVWGAQFEAGSGASSYIPTGASTVQRLADNCVMTGTNFSSWYNQGEGTFLIHCQLNRLFASHLLNVNVNNAAPRLMITELSSQFNAASENPSGTNFSFALGSSSTNSTKVIAAFKSLDNAGTRNGGTVQTNATLTVPTTVNLMRIGSAEGGYQYMTGTISLLKYWPTRLPNAQLQALTT